MMHLCRKMLALLILCASPLFYTSTQAHAEHLTLGMSSDFSGGNAAMSVDFAAGMTAAFKRYESAYPSANINVISVDDGYEPSRTIYNIHNLIEQKKVVALIGNVGTPTATTTVPIIREKKVLFFAPISGSSLLRPTTTDHYIIHYRASYYQEIEALMKALLTHTSLTGEDIAVFGQQDSFGDGGRQHVKDLIHQYHIPNATAVLQMDYPRNSLAVEYAVADLLVQHPTPKVIFMIGSSVASAKFIRMVRQYGLDPLFVGISFMGDRRLASHLKNIKARILISQVVPSLDSALPITKEFHTDMQHFSPGGSLTPLSLEGYIAARILTKALIPGYHMNQEMLIDSLESLGSFDLGLGVPLKLTPTEHQASQSVWLTQLKEGEYHPISVEQAAQLLNETNEGAL